MKNKERIAKLEEEVAALKREVDRLRREQTWKPLEPRPRNPWTEPYRYPWDGPPTKILFTDGGESTVYLGAAQ